MNRAEVASSRPKITAQEFDILVHRFNDTARAYPEDGLIHESFESMVQRTPEAIALIDQHRRLTYADLDQRANEIAHALVERGVGPDARVGLYAQRSIDAVVGMLGILKAGGAYVPLDPHYPRERLSFMVADSAPLVVLAAGRDAEQLADLGVRVVPLDNELHQPATKPVVHGLTSRSLAYVIYTSGSTGQPKGVMVEHRSVLRLVINSTYAPLRDVDCVAHCSSPSFDAATWEVWATLLAGARLVVVPHDVVLDPHAFNALLLEQGVTVLWLTVGLFNEYVDVMEESFGRLNYLLTGGDVLNPRTVVRAMTKARRPRHLISAYGPTETTTFATTYPVPATVKPEAPVPIGGPISNTSIYILDEERSLVPVGAVGEICIGGPGAARGYLNQPALTAERFVPDPFSELPDAKLYRSGDLGRWRADGIIEYLGRNDTQVKIRGFRVELGEVEAVLRRFPDVKEAAAVARVGDDGHKRLIAYAVGAPERIGTDVRGDSQQRFIAGLIAHLKEYLPPYMRPAAIVLLPTLPLNANGKVDRRALPAPGRGAFVAAEHVAPEGETEQELARVWREILSLEQVGRYDDFVALGGDSMMAMKLIVRLADQLHVHLNVDDVFRSSSLLQLATLVELRRSASVPPRAASPDEFDDISV